MKETLSDNRFQPACLARFQHLLILALAIAGLSGLLAQSVPDRMNYQGLLLKGDGTPVPAGPTEVVFRIYDAADGGELLWSRSHIVTPDTNGLFSVVLMDGGSPYETAQHTNLPPVFTSGSDSRFLELFVPGPGAAPIKPRQRFVTAPYAFLAQNVKTANQDFTVAGTLTVNGAAQVNSLTSAGGAKVGSLVSLGSISASNSTVTASNFVGYGTIPIGGIIMWAGVTPPDGWALCDGSTVSGKQTPNLRGRFILASGTGVGGNLRNPGETGGKETHVLTELEMPRHKHTVTPAQAKQDEYGFGGSEMHFAIGPSWPGEVDYISYTGGSQAHTNMPPYYVLAFIMRVK